LIEIGPQVGCADQSHFSALFRRHVAMTPKPTATPPGVRSRRGAAVRTQIPYCRSSGAPSREGVPLLPISPSGGGTLRAAHGARWGRFLSSPRRSSQDSNTCRKPVTDSAGRRRYSCLGGRRCLAHQQSPFPGSTGLPPL
jgi:hypothetical protein